jgi:hypothetical protein
MRQEHNMVEFPSTNVTWIAMRMAEGEPGLIDIRRHIMERYAGPLAEYVRRSSLRTAGDTDEIVNGYFVSTLAQDGYLERWLGTGVRLRRWVMNGLILHAKGIVRDRLRETGRLSQPTDTLDMDHAAPESDAVRAFDQAWAHRLIEEACSLAAERMAAEGRGRRFELFRRHVLQGRRSADVASELGFRPQETSAVVRSATQAVRQALRDLLAQDGVTERELDQEYRELRSLLESG